MKVTSHPNGFRRVTFREEANGVHDRLHVWKTRMYEDGDIPQHPSGFTSTIIEGVMREQLFEAVEDENGDYERWTVNCWTDDEGVYHVDELATRKRCRVVLLKEIEHSEGETYHRPASDLHKVIAEEVPLITWSTTEPKKPGGHFMLRKLPEGGRMA